MTVRRRRLASLVAGATAVLLWTAGPAAAEGADGPREVPASELVDASVVVPGTDEPTGSIDPVPDAAAATQPAGPAAGAVLPAQEDLGTDPDQAPEDPEEAPVDPGGEPTEPAPVDEGACRAVNDGTELQGCDGEPICTIEPDGTETCVLGNQVTRTAQPSSTGSTSPSGGELARTGPSDTTMLSAAALALLAAGTAASWTSHRLTRTKQAQD